MEIRNFENDDRPAVVSLWNAVFPNSTGHNDPEQAIARKVAVKDTLFFVAVEDRSLVGTVLGGYDGHRGWVYSLAVDPNWQRRSVGTQLIRHVESAIVKLGCPKVNLQVRADNSGVVSFYRSLGYQTEERISMGKILGILLLVVFCLSPLARAADEATAPVLVESRRIWDEAPHSAFTDLIRFRDQWVCVFREGQGHVAADGALRIITSTDGNQWQSAALISSPDSDLRDAKISITPDNRLMLAGAEAIPHPETKKTYKHRSLVWFSEDGKNWSAKHKIAEPDFWLWRITWHKDKAYGFGYATGKSDRMIRLYGSDDGKQFQTLVENAAPGSGYANETSMVFAPDDNCYCLLRRDGKPDAGLLGTAKPPYTKWNWQDLGVKIGGPDMVRLPDGRFIAAVRLYDGKVRTSLCWVDVEKGTLTEALKLPSGGDCSYAGMVWHDDLLWVSYYSSHEEKTCIYLAKVRFENK